MKKKLSLKNIYLLSVIGIGLIGLALGSTYAMFITNVEIDNPISLNTNLSSENDIIETVEVTVPSSDHIEVPLTINNQSSSTLNYSTFYVSSSSDIEVGTKLSNSDSSIPTGTISSNTTKKVYVQIKNNTSSSLTITLGVSSSINNIVLSSSMTIVPNTELTFSKKLSDYITNLYTSATKTEATNNSITYNYAASVGLMNDRLGSMSTGIDAGNIRYYGATPNNYIYFNCSDYSNQTSSTCETWRIIGVFDDKVKIMRGSIIGSYSWDTGTTHSTPYSNYGANEWSQADAMKLLNNGYESEKVGGSLYWNSKSGTCYNSQTNATISCNFTSTGLKNDTTRNMISETTYYTRGHSTPGVYANEIYDKERVSGTVISDSLVPRKTTWSGKVALPYPSDYGYAVDLNLCQKKLFSYDTTCSENNWMKTIIAPSNGWLLTPKSDHKYIAWRVHTTGSIYYNLDNISAAHGIVPVLHLDSEIKINNDGDGSSTNPYQIVS